MNQAQKLMAELEENGFSFYGARRQLALSIMEKYLAESAQVAAPMSAVEPGIAFTVPGVPHVE